MQRSLKGHNFFPQKGSPFCAQPSGSNEAVQEKRACKKKPLVVAHLVFFLAICSINNTQWYQRISSHRQSFSSLRVFSHYSTLFSICILYTKKLSNPSSLSSGHLEKQTTYHLICGALDAPDDERCPEFVNERHRTAWSTATWCNCRTTTWKGTVSGPLITLTGARPAGPGHHTKAGHYPG
jgi:hypothetical protein